MIHTAFLKNFQNMSVSDNLESILIEQGVLGNNRLSVNFTLPSSPDVTFINLSRYVHSTYPKHYRSNIKIQCLQTTIDKKTNLTVTEDFEKKAPSLKVSQKQQPY
jgi:hypothetical protein